MSTSQKYDAGDNYANPPTAAIAAHQAISLDSPPTIRQYFMRVRDLVKSGEPFPVCLDEVWHLVYNKRSDAVAILTKDFVPEVDYVFMRKSPQKSKGRPTEVYNLTAPCMEWLIARKVREIFEVYREVFHWTMDALQNSMSEKLTALIGIVNDQTERIIGLEGRIDRMHKARVRYFKAKVDDRKVKHQQKEATEAKAKRDKAVEILGSTVHMMYETMNWRSRWQDVWDTLKKDYNVDITRYRPIEGEHLIDVAVRIGLIDQVYEIIRFKIAKWNR